MRQLLRQIITLSIIFLFVGCAGVATKKTPTTKPAAHEYALQDLCVGKDLDFSLDSLSQSLTVSRGDHAAKGLIGSEIVMLDNEQVQLSAPVKYKNGTVIVPLDFKEKVIDRLIASPEQVNLYRMNKVNTIILDAGHGGKDPGAIGPSGVQEKDIVLDITKKLRKILEHKGYKVVMTRDKDEFITLKDRTVIASSVKADLFVSVHANAHDKKSVNGVEVYSLRDLDVFEKNEAQRQENHDVLFSHLQMKKNDEELNHILSDMLYDYKQAESISLAANTSQKVSQFLDAKVLGQKSSHFFVLRNTLIPAVLVEVGYLTNPKEEKLLKTEAYRQKVAYAISRSIFDYANTK